jgi:D-arabinose 1-dehydrogenase-like Zn-dependent alcohol dehydrogenase
MDIQCLNRRKITSNSNNIYHKAKLSGKVDDEILEEYTKLKKVSKLPVPEPFDVINNPEKYKPIISMILNNEIMTTLGKTHSYVKYFNLLANKIGVISNNVPNNTMYNDIMNAVKNKNIETHTHVETPVETINHNITNANSDTEED